MKKDRLYLYTFLSITIIYIIIAGIAVQYLAKASISQLIDIQLESSRREAKEIASMVSYQIQNGIDKEIIKANVQSSIENTNLETSFISMFNWSGIEVCHPDKRLLGQKTESDQPLINSVDDDINPEDFYKILLDNQQINDFNNTGKVSRTIYTVIVENPNSDWIIGAHINVTNTLSQIKSLKNKFYTIFIIMGFIVILSFVIIVRLIGSFYEKKLEAENKKLEDEVISLAKLNKAIDKFQQKASEEKLEQKLEKVSSTSTDENIKEKGKKRILTYLRHEILTVNTEDIAYIYTENTITYVVDVKGKRSTVNSSLDELQSNFDDNFFYRANRQFIISITAIEKIIRYGNSQLKILMIPASETDIIIGKNKASEFKQWLNL